MTEAPGYFVECPCCHGARALLLVDFADVAGLRLSTETFVFCCHCQGEGRIPAEQP